MKINNKHLNIIYYKQILLLISIIFFINFNFLCLGSNIEKFDQNSIIVRKNYTNNFKRAEKYIQQTRFSRAYRELSSILSYVNFKNFGLINGLYFCETALKSEKYMDCLKYLKILENNFKTSEHLTEINKIKEKITIIKKTIELNLNKIEDTSPKKISASKITNMSHFHKKQWINQFVLNKVDTLCAHSQIIEAEKLLQEAFIIDPFNKEICFKKAKIEFVQRKFSKALNTIESFNPVSYDEMLLTNIIMYKFYEDLLKYNENSDIETDKLNKSICKKIFMEVVNYAKFILLKFPDEPEINFLCAFYFKINKIDDKAEKGFKKAFSLDNKLGIALIELTKFYIDKHLPKTALNEIIGYLKINPSYSDLLFSLALALEKISVKNSIDYNAVVNVYFQSLRKINLSVPQSNLNPLKINPLYTISKPPNEKTILEKIFKICLNNDNYTWSVAALTKLLPFKYTLKKEDLDKIEGLRKLNNLPNELNNHEITSLVSNYNFPFKISGPLKINKKNLKNKKYISILSPEPIKNFIIIPELPGLNQQIFQSINYPGSLTENTFSKKNSENSFESYKFIKKIRNQDYLINDENAGPEFLYQFKNKFGNPIFFGYKNIKLTWTVIIKDKPVRLIKFDINNNYDSEKAYELPCAGLIDPLMLNEPGLNITLKAELSGSVYNCHVTSVSNEKYYITKMDNIKKFSISDEFISVCEEP